MTENNTLEEISKRRTESWVENLEKFEAQSSNGSTSSEVKPKRPDTLSLSSKNDGNGREVELREKSSTKIGKSIRRTLRNSFNLKRSASEPAVKGNRPQPISPLVPITHVILNTPPLPKRQPSTPLLIEDPPSSDEDRNHHEDHVKLFGDPSFLNGSSGSFAGGLQSPGARGGPRSAPGTPLGAHEGPPQPQPIQRSPSHTAFTQRDKASLKHLSTSTPAMTAQAHLGDPPSPKASSRDQPKERVTSKARQKKFLRHFPNVDDDERVLNHYSCALIGDILLQGHLYITKNYFAFYSNVFGYVTKLLIPILTVEDITKEKTARIIPNAVGITTGDDKHVFGSLMSRDSTLQYMRAVWEKAKTASEELAVPEVDVTEQEQDSSESGELESGRESPSPEILTAPPATFSVMRKRRSEDARGAGDDAPPERKGSRGFVRTLKDAIGEFRKLPRQSLILFATTLLLILLFLSAAVLLYRISKIQSRYSMALGDGVARDGDGDDIYNDILQWQTHLHSKSAGAVHTFLDNNLDQIAKVRQSLEALSTLLVQNNNGNNAQQQQRAEGDQRQS